MSYNITVTAHQLSVTDATESTPLVTIRKPTSGGSDVTVDTALDTSSYNAIANAPVATAVNTLNASLTDQASDISALQSQIAGVSSTYPKVVTLASAMTDTSVIYLYAGRESGYYAGDLYYWNGSAWTDGGTYGTGTISTNARNLLITILRNAVYNADMSDNITALNTSLQETTIPGRYAIIYDLTGVETDSSTSDIRGGESFTCTLSLASGYTTITDVSVTMGGTDITSDVYSSGTVTIASVTGTVTITAYATTALYPLTSGTHTFATTKETVVVSHGNHVKVTYPSDYSTTSDNRFINLSQLALNGTTSATEDSINNIGITLFTLPSGSSVTYEMKNINHTYEEIVDDQPNSGQFMWTQRKTSTSTGTGIKAGYLHSATLSVGTATMTEDTHVSCCLIYMQRIKPSITVEFDLSLTVDGEQWI